jgi:ketosteroid isomerase-like protein
LANAYCKEGLILPPGADIIMGREAIKQSWILPKGVSVPHHKITPVEITVKDDWAYDIGYYEGTTIKRNGDKVNFRGKYVIVWKKEDGDWKIYADAWNRID